MGDYPDHGNSWLDWSDYTWGNTWDDGGITVDVWQPPETDDTPRASKFDDLPPEVLSRIASFIASTSVLEIQEVRACNCLVTKKFPFRDGTTRFSRDTHTGSDVRTDDESCKLDKGRLAPWCLKQYLFHSSGRRRSIPTFAVANKRLYRKWLDARVYVFCAESCLAAAIRRLSTNNIRVMTKVRFFERSNHQDTIQHSRESYETGLSGKDQQLVYSNEGMTEIVYHGMKVWVKDLCLQAWEF